ncbi:transposase [Streptomyces sp. NPDC001513]|uniref:transposase n=1 Tax=Streptomyces sp. NPDC001513 TaxID=3364580 RepID=UPI0036970E49
MSVGPDGRAVDAIFYVVRTGCAWRQLPKDFPPWPTVYWYFTWWHDDGTVERVHDALRDGVREADGRNAEPSAGARDYETIPARSETVIRWAMIGIMVLTRGRSATRPGPHPLVRTAAGHAIRLS